jgi:hypothetical protein
VLVLLYRRHLGYGLGNGSNTHWNFQSAFNAIGLFVDEEQMSDYWSYFVDQGWGKFDGPEDPSFVITEKGEDAARAFIARKLPLYSPDRLRTWDWAIYGTIAAIVAAAASVVGAIFAFQSIG